MYTPNYSLFSTPKLEDNLPFIGRKWLISEIREWLQDPNGQRYFLITGKAGTGKSAIMSYIKNVSEGKINDENIGNNSLAASFFCDARDFRSWLPDVFSNSLSHQVMLRYSEYVSEYITRNRSKFLKLTDNNTIIEIIQKDIIAPKVIGPIIENLVINELDQQTLFNQIFLQFLEFVLEKNPNETILILIDALDESFRDNYNKSIISLINNLNYLSKNIRFIITSRDEYRITDNFSDVRSVCLSGDSRLDNEKDVIEYISFRLKKGGVTSGFDELMTSLYQKSNGIFLHLKLLFDSVDRGEFSLQKEEIDKIPPGLDGLYHEFFIRVKRRNEVSWNLNLLPILHLLSTSFEALDETQIGLFLTKSNYEIRNGLRELTPFLLEEQGGSDNKYSLYHPTLISFFRSKECVNLENGIQTSKMNSFYISEYDAHRKIVSTFFDKITLRIEIQKLNNYAVTYLLEHLYVLIDHEDYEGIDWYKILLTFIDNKEFYQRKQSLFPNQSVFYLKDLRVIYNAGLNKNDPLSLSKTLLVLRNLVRGSKEKNPISILLDTPALELDTHNLNRSLILVRLYDNDTRFIWSLLISLILKIKGKIQEAKQVLENIEIENDFMLTKYEVIAIFCLIDLYAQFPSIVKRLILHVRKEHIESFSLEIKHESLEEFIEMLISESQGEGLYQLMIFKPLKYNDYISARQITYKISNLYIRSHMLAAIGIAQAKNGDFDNAKDSFKESIEFVSKLQNKDDQISATSSIVNSIIKFPQILSDVDYVIKSILDVTKGRNHRMMIKIIKNQMIYKQRDQFVVMLNLFQTSLQEAISNKDNFTIMGSPEGIQNEAEFYTNELVIELCSIYEFLFAIGEPSFYNYFSTLNTSSKIRCISNIAVAQAQNKDFVGAIQTANTISDYQTLSLIAKIQAQNKDFVGAIQTANTISDNYTKSETLATIAVAQVEESKIKSIDTFAKSILATESKSIFRKNDLSEPLATIAVAQAQNKDFVGAIQTANTISDNYTKSETLATIAVAQAQNKDFVGAIQTANTISDNYTKSETLATIINHLVKNGKNELFDQAVTNITEISILLKCLKKIIVKLAQSVNIVESIKMFEKVKQIVLTISDYPTYFLSTIGVIQSQFGFFVEAANTFKEVITRNNRILDSDEKSRNASKISIDLVVFGDFDLAIQTANTISDNYTKSKTLATIAVAQAQRLNLKVVSETFKNAIEAASKIYDTQDKSVCFSHINSNLILLKQYSAAIEAINNIPLTNFKAYPLEELAKSYIKEKDFTRALNIALTIPHEYTQTQSISTISVAQAQSEDFAGAIMTASRISHTSRYYFTLAKIASINFQKNFSESEAIFHDTIEKLMSNDKIIDKSGIMKGIIEHIIKTGKSSFALRYVHHIKEPSILYSILIEIAEIQHLQNDSGAITTYYLASNEAHAIPDPYLKATTLTNFSKRLKKSNLILESNSVLLKAIQATTEINNESFRDQVLTNIFKELINLKNITLVKKLADRFSIDHNRNQVLIDGAKECLKINAYQEAIGLMEKIGPDKSYPIFHIVSSTETINEKILNYIFDVCYMFPEITILMTSYIAKQYKKSFDDIRVLILNSLNKI